ncbi:MAG TPA: TonB-dependent receptor [Acidobacteriaceae bacterium]|nr:TonB-dependent receptor [Acidobacteriaceae bacterium]
MRTVREYSLKFRRSIQIAGKLFYLFLFVSGACLTAPQLRAQAVGGGQIQGTITDESGSAVSGATVEVVQQDSGLKRTVTSGSDGGYNLPNLPVGPYQLDVSGTGFSAYHQSGIVIQVGNNLRIDVKLQVGGVTQTVQVNAAASMVQTEDQSISQVIDKQRTVDLPLNGRQATQLILLTGAATTAPGTDLVTSKNYPSSVALSVAGAQGTSINYLMDGADNNDAFTNVNLPFPFPDALQEFSVQTSGLSAEYGLHPGAVVNIVTRSGGNAYHGVIFNFFRNGDMNARNYFSVKQDSLKRNQFGGTVGGPIRKDKLFFFGGYQGTRTRQETNAITSFVPTQAMLNGDFSAYYSAPCQPSNKQLNMPGTKTPFPNNQIPTSLFNPAALQMITKYLPRATNPCGKIVYGIPQPQNEDQFIGRLDWTANQKQTVFGRYFVTHYTQPGFFNNNLLLTANPSLNDQAQSFTLGHTYTISSNLVNSLRINGTRNYITRATASDLINPTTVGIQVSSPVKNYIYMSVAGAFTASCGVCESTDITTNAVNLVDDVFWTKGKHHWSFGFNYIHNYLVYDGTNNANGQFNFNGVYTNDGLVDFMLGGLQSLYQGNNTGVDFSKNYFAGYAQDSIQMSPRLTLNAGIRWESSLPAVETTGRGASFSLANYSSGVKSGVYPTAPPGLLFYGDRGIPRGYYHAHYDHFEPRIGFAYDPRGLGEESIRGSYTVGFQEPVLYYQSHFEAMAPWGDSITLVQPTGGLSNPYAGFPGGNPYPKPFPPTAANAFFPTSGSYFVVPTNLKPSYTQTWNLSIEKQFLKNWVVTASYLGNHVLHSSAGNEQNPAVYIPGTCGGSPCSTTQNTNARRKLTLINPSQGGYFTQITQAYDGIGGSYNGVVFSIEHRFATYFTLLSNYTYSHCMSGPPDNGDNAGNQFQDPSNPNADYSNCGADLRQNFVTSIVTRSSFGGSPMKRALLSNWQLAPIISATTGVPFTVTSGQDKSLTGVGQDRPNLVGSPYAQGQGRTKWLNFSSFAFNAPGTYGDTRPYQFYGPHYVDVDTAVTKFVPLHEDTQLEARAECFNCLNHTNFGNPGGSNTGTAVSNPGTALNTGTFGVITASNPPRILQLSLKIDF